MLANKEVVVKMTFRKQFIGRETELEVLDSHYVSSHSEMCIVYGRRRIGKSTLIEKFCDDKPCFFYLAGKETKQSQLKRFVKELGNAIEDPLTGKTGVSTWDEALTLLDRSLATLSQTGGDQTKVVVVFDEFQWMCHGANELLSDLQRFWDKRWQHSGLLQLILCGSSISFMLGNVLSRKSPLFGRRSLSLNLEPFCLSETRLFFPRRNLREIAEIYMTVGGVPKYLELFARGKSYRSTVRQEAFSKTGFFYDEIRFVLGEQLKQTEQYFVILEQIANRPISIAQLAKRTGLPSGQIVYYLERLQVLGFVSRHIPFGASHVSKKVRYRLDDYYLRFYFSFIHPNRQAILNGNLSFREATGDRFNNYLGLTFEQVARDHARSIVNALEYDSQIVEIGSYWQQPTKRKKGVQIDLIVDLADEITLVCECKWSRSKVGVDAAEALVSRVESCPNRRQKNLVPVLVTSSGVTKTVLKRKELSSVTIDDLFKG